MKILGKRFVFTSVAIICVSVTACYLKYSGEIYLKIIGTLATLYLAGQSFTDAKSIKKEG